MHFLPPHGVDDSAVFTSRFPCPRLPSRPFPRSFTSSWPGTAPLRDCSMFPVLLARHCALPLLSFVHREAFGALGAGSGAWYFSLVFPLYFLIKCLTEFRQLAKNFYSKVADLRCPVSSPNLFVTHCTIRCIRHLHSLSTIDLVFGLRLDTLERDYLLVPSPSFPRIKKSCTMLRPSVSA